MQQASLMWCHNWKKKKKKVRGWHRVWSEAGPDDEPAPPLPAGGALSAPSAEGAAAAAAAAAGQQEAQPQVCPYACSAAPTAGFWIQVLECPRDTGCKWVPLLVPRFLLEAPGVADCACAEGCTHSLHASARERLLVQPLFAARSHVCIRVAAGTVAVLWRHLPHAAAACLTIAAPFCISALGLQTLLAGLERLCLQADAPNDRPGSGQAAGSSGTPRGQAAATSSRPTSATGEPLAQLRTARLGSKPRTISQPTSVSPCTRCIHSNTHSPAAPVLGVISMAVWMGALSAIPGGCPIAEPDTCACMSSYTLLGCVCTDNGMPGNSGQAKQATQAQRGSRMDCSPASQRPTSLRSQTRDPACHSAC